MNRLLPVTVVALLLCAGLTAQEEVMPPFAEIDKDMDEFLSIGEAQAAFPELALSDSNNNGYLDKREAENALPGLAYTDDTHEDAEERIGTFEYTLMAERFMRVRNEGDSGE